MKQLFVIQARLMLSALLFLPAAPAFTQVESGAPANEPFAVVIEPVKMNVLYIGVDNPLAILAEGVSGSDLQVRFTDKGTVEYLGGNRYVARMTAPGTTYLEVYHRDMLIGKRTYRIKRIPDPAPMVGSTPGGNITHADLLRSPGLEALLPNYEGPGECIVKGYQVTVVPKTADPVKLVVQGSAFTQDLINLINDNTAGTALFFSDIKVQCPGDSAARNIGNLNFILTD